MNIGLDSSVVEHLTSDAGVLGSIPVQPYIFMCIFLYLFVPPIPPTFIAVAFPVQAFVINESWHGELVFVVCVFEGKDFIGGRIVVVWARWTYLGHIIRT